MFPPPYRLPLRGSRGFFRTARSIHTRQLSVFWKDFSDFPHSRAAIIVKKTTAPLSTQRSAIKRKLRAVILPQLAPSVLFPSRDYVFIYKGSPTATSKELAAYVTEAIKKSATSQPLGLGQATAISLVRAYQSLRGALAVLLISTFGIQFQCKHSPTCSEYAISCIKQYGTMRGSWKGLRRILSCY